MVLGEDQGLILALPIAHTLKGTLGSYEWEVSLGSLQFSATKSVRMPRPKLAMAALSLVQQVWTTLPFLGDWEGHPECDWFPRHTTTTAQSPHNE